jgi:hypothetical protein
MGRYRAAAAEAARRCERCRKRRPDVEFFSRLIGGTVAYSSRCRDCHRDAAAELHDALVGTPDYKAMLRSQRGRCALCGGEPPPDRREGLFVDLDPIREVVRGLVCRCCLPTVHLLEETESRNRVLEYVGLVPR